MKNVFRRAAILAIAVFTTSVAGNAQKKGDMAVGGNLVMATADDFTNYGIGAKFQYNATDPLRLEGSFTYFPKKDYVTMWDFSVNGHWLFPLSARVTAYPLAGLGILGTKASMPVEMGDLGVLDVSGSSSKLVLNLGGGMDFKMSEELIFNIELKYKISDNLNQLMPSIGLTYWF